jgi:hypothetical protein
MYILSTVLHVVYVVASRMCIYNILVYTRPLCQSKLCLVKSKSNSCYDRQSVAHSVLMSTPIWSSWPDFNYCLTVTVLSLWGALSDERTSLVYIQLLLVNKTCICTIYTWPLSVLTEDSRSCPILSSSHYNGSLVTWTVVRFTAKFKPLIFSVPGFAFSHVANIYIFIILYNFCLLPA